MERRFCRLCEILDGIPEDTQEHAEKLYRLLPEENRAEEELIKRRLSICGDCEKETEGTCLACGCYTLFRAMAKDQKCPHKKWQGAESVRS